MVNLSCLFPYVLRTLIPYLRCLLRRANHLRLHEMVHFRFQAYYTA